MTWHPDMPLAYRDNIVAGDSRILAEAMPDESVDLIFTDPPYPREFLPLYGWLSETAARVLRPGGYCFAYGACEHLPETLRQMETGRLAYFWTDALMHHGSVPRMWHKHPMSGYKPVLVFTKGSPARAPWRSTLHVGSMDKRFHEWGQGSGYALKTIDMLTQLAEVVWDPFCGGGTTLAVCKFLGRSFVGFEIEPGVAERARARVGAISRQYQVETRESGDEAYLFDV